MEYNNEDKAKMLITYAADEAPTLQEASDCFNSHASEIKNSTIEELYALVDGDLA